MQQGERQTDRHIARQAARQEARQIREWPDLRRDRAPEILPVPTTTNPVAGSLAALIHDTRNMVASMELYCDLLDEPGVLAERFRHYSGGLRLVAVASQRLLQKLSLLDPIDTGTGAEKQDVYSNTIPFGQAHPFDAFTSEYAPLSRPGRQRIVPSKAPVLNLIEELQANCPLLSALVGPGITLALSLPGPAAAPLCSIAMAPDNLTRILINLARNAATAMPSGGHIQIDLDKHDDNLELTFSDTGHGIPEDILESVFAPGFTTKVDFDGEVSESSVTQTVHGLGLAIVRALVQEAGGSVYAMNRVPKRAAQVSAGAVIAMRFPLSR